VAIGCRQMAVSDLESRRCPYQGSDPATEHTAVMTSDHAANHCDSRVRVETVSESPNITQPRDIALYASSRGPAAFRALAALGSHRRPRRQVRQVRGYAFRLVSHIVMATFTVQ